MTIYKRIDIDLASERARIAKAKYNKRQRAALTKLVDLFEAGKWQECLDHVKRAFPYNEDGKYPELEHIGTEIVDVLSSLGHANFYTGAELLKQAAELDARAVRSRPQASRRKSTRGKSHIPPVYHAYAACAARGRP
jgi:hypothetical protein